MYIMKAETVFIVGRRCFSEDLQVCLGFPVKFYIIKVCFFCSQVLDATGHIDIKLKNFLLKRKIECDCKIRVCEPFGGCDPFFLVCVKDNRPSELRGK